MHAVKSVTLIGDEPCVGLPEAARRTDGKLRAAKWKYFEDEKGKGYRDKKTGYEARAKK